MAKKIAEKEREKKRVNEHLNTLQSLILERANRVASLETELKLKEEAVENDKSPVTPYAEKITAKICRTQLWNDKEYRQYLSSLTEERHIIDVGGYLSLIQEGNEAVRSKISMNGSSGDAKSKRSRRFDRDYYRTCVSEGLRSICYKFVLSPLRAGIKLEETISSSDGFNFDRRLGDDLDEDSNNPAGWIPPHLENDPATFANELIGSGELVLLSTIAGDSQAADSELRDPLKACRYVAAMELANEPRIKRFCRQIYRRNVLMTTRPTKKGLHNIHSHHEYYGLHLIKGKLVADHFPAEDKEEQMYGLSLEERNQMNEDLKKLEKESCLQFLRILEAVRSGDVTAQIHMPLITPLESSMTIDERKNINEFWYKRENISKQGVDLSPFTNILEQIYLNPNGDSEEWIEERKKIIRQSLTDFLLPQFESEIRQDLKKVAFKYGVETVSDALENMAMEGPYRPNYLFGENRYLVPTGDLPVVGVCVSNDGKAPSYLASLTEKGEVSDNLAIPGGANFSELKQSIIRFLIMSRPAAVVVGTSGHKFSSMMAQKLGECITEATEKWNNRLIQHDNEDDDEYHARRQEFLEMGIDEEYDDDDDEPDWKCNVDLVDDNISQLFGRSQVRGEKEFPEFHMNLRCAISIARYAQNPLAELCYAWSVASDAGAFGTELLHLNVHRYQRLVPKTLLLKGYERRLCKVVAAVGVDVNAACTNDHIHGMLQFVAGFGPRKALALRQNLTRTGGVIGSRRDLLAKRLIGPTVYNNAVAFLRIRAKDRLEGQNLHPLDDTRVHPDVYHRNAWATKIAMDALDIRNPAESNENSAIRALRDVMADSQEEVRRLSEAVKAEYENANRGPFIAYSWNPKSVAENAWQDKVGLLDLEMFAKMIEKKYMMGKWLSHLVMIVWEFRLPFEDPRKPVSHSHIEFLCDINPMPNTDGHVFCRWKI